VAPGLEQLSPVLGLVQPGDRTGRRTLEIIKRQLGTPALEAQYQQRPVPLESCTLQPHQHGRSAGVAIRDWLDAANGAFLPTAVDANTLVGAHSILPSNYGWAFTIFGLSQVISCELCC
jgi:hypothetical protein